MKKLTFILSTFILLGMSSTSYSSIVVMGGAESVETDGTNTKIICGDNRAAVCAVINQTQDYQFAIEPERSGRFLADEYWIHRLPEGRSIIIAKTLKK